MTDITCKCGVSRLEDIQCAVCGEYFKSGWIPVSERLPEINEGWVIVYDNRNKVYPGVYEAGHWLNDMLDKLYHFEKVTHWMPLPPPPEAE